MRKLSPLTRAFLEQHPAEAARVLEQVAPASAAALLNTLPLPVTTEVLRHMLAAHAARCLERLKPAAGVGLLRALPAQTGAGLLRYLPPAQRDAWLRELPTNVALSLRLLLSYPEDSVGAWVDARVPALAPATTARQALERARRAKDSAADVFYVVDDDLRLLGTVRLADLIRANARAPLAQLAQRTAPVLAASAPVAAAANNAGWVEYRSLAVVDIDGRFLGALHYPRLVRALAHVRTEPLANTVAHALTDVLNVYWSLFSRLIVLAVPVVRQALTRRSTP